VTTSESQTPASQRGFPIGLTVAVAIAMAILIGLGLWQVRRLVWKQDLLARVAALQAAPSRPLADALEAAAAGQDVDFTRVSLDCPGLASAPFVELYALRDGEAGSRIVSACPVTAGGVGSILVDRGFVADTVSARPAVNPGDVRPITVVGILRKPDKRSFAAPPDSPSTRKFYTRDAAVMAPLLGAAKPSPLFLLTETATNPELPALVPAPIPAEISNRHMEYVLTWFGLAATLACVYAAMLWRRLRA
jgi:surfeit locus 1 family protein